MELSNFILVPENQITNFPYTGGWKYWQILPILGIPFVRTVVIS
jgi:hypothetical protein